MKRKLTAFSGHILPELKTRHMPLYQVAPRRFGQSKRGELKRAIWLRDGGRCCMCNALVDLCSSQLDHRVALQFIYQYGMTKEQANSPSNQWTLCIECHNKKSARELQYNAPDELALTYPEPAALNILDESIVYIAK